LLYNENIIKGGDIMSQINKIDVNKSLGDIILRSTDSVEIFNLYKLDYCCGGDESLDSALKELRSQNVDTDKLLDELNRKYEAFLNRNEETRDWKSESPSSLIKHILDTHHVYTKKTLQDLDDMIIKILKVHYSDHGEELLKVHSLFGNLKTELEAHLIKEEENLFPMILEYEKTKNENLKSQIKTFIDETESEHDVAGDVLKELEKVTRDFTAPDGACTTFKRAYMTLDDLEKDIFTHIHLENSVLFKMF
jgi:regulator of cell morphogenesis and NO signaling